MSSPIVNVQITGDSSQYSAAAATAVDSTQQFVNSVGQVPPSVGAATEAEQAFTASIQQLQSTIAAFQSGLDAIPEKLEHIGESFHRVHNTGGELPSLFKRIETSAEMREASLAIRETIENPLNAAKHAAEAFFLSFGAAGLVATGVLAIGAAATEAAISVGEVGREYTQLASQLGIDAEASEKLARTWEILGLDSGTLIQANRTLSRVLQDGSEHGREIREEAERMGISFRDANGDVKPFDELMMHVVTTLGNAKDKQEATRVGTELMGRGYIRAAAAAHDLGDANDYVRDHPGLDDEEIEKADKFALKYSEVKDRIKELKNEFGLFAEQVIVWTAGILGSVDDFAGKLDEAFGTDKAGLESWLATFQVATTTVTIGLSQWYDKFNLLNGIILGSIPGVQAWTKSFSDSDSTLQKWLDFSSVLGPLEGFFLASKVFLGSAGPPISDKDRETKVDVKFDGGPAAQASAALQAALRPLGGAAAEAEKHFQDLQRELGKYNENADTYIIKSGLFANKTVAQAAAEVQAARSIVEAYKAASEATKIREQAITSLEKHQLALIELEKKGSEDSFTAAKKSADDRMKLAVDAATQQAAQEEALITTSHDPATRVASEVSAINQKLAIQQRGTVESLAIEQQYRDSLVRIADAELAHELSNIAQRFAVEVKSIRDQIAVQESVAAKAPDLEKRLAAQAAIKKLQAELVARADQTAIAEKAANDKAIAAKSAADARYNEEKQKAEEKNVLTQNESTAKVINLADEQAERIRTRIDQITEENAAAENKKQQDLIETEIKHLESEQRIRNAELESAGAGYQQRIALVNQYAARINDAIARLNELRIAEAAAKDARENKKAQESIGPIISAPGVAAPPPVPISTVATLEAEATAAKAVAAQTDKTRQAVEQLNKQAQSQEFNNYFARMNIGLTQAINSWVSGSQTFANAFSRVLTGMVSGWINTLAMMGVKWIEHHLLLRAIQTAFEATAAGLHIQTATAKAAIDLTYNAKTVALQSTLTTFKVTSEAAIAAAHVSSIAAQTAAEATGNAAAAPIRVAEVVGAAGVGAANAYAATAAIPFVGPELAPGVAAATFTAIMAFATPAAFEQGGLVGADPTLALLHPREMVLPRNLSERVQDMSSSPETNQGGAQGSPRSTAGGDKNENSNSTVLHLHYAPTIHNGGGNQDMRSLLSEHADHIGTIVSKQFRKFNR